MCLDQIGGDIEVMFRKYLKIKSEQIQRGEMKKIIQLSYFTISLKLETNYWWGFDSVIQFLSILV